MATVTVSVMFLIIASQTVSQQPQLQPMNITRTAGETYVFIPCPFEFSSTRSIWRINGTDYTAATLPSFYSLTPGGLFIITVHICLDQVSFQCIDISSNSLQEEVSHIGVLTVISLTGENCTDDDLREFLGSGTDASGFELDHRHMQYGSINTTLAWKIMPAGSECNMSRILSYRPCQQNNPDINVTIDDTRITVPSTSLYISGQLGDFSLSSLSKEDTVQCEGLVGNDTIRINVNETEIVNVLLGNNDCSCAQLERLEELYFAVSNPDPNELDIICPIYAGGNPCYSPKRCNNFIENNITAFFKICGNSENSFLLCSSNVTKQLNGLRLDFFTITRAPCTPVYYRRTYVQSFEFMVAKASSNVEVNIASQQICFSSVTDCSLANLTQYNVAISDLSGNVIFEKNRVPESTCLTVEQLGLLPQCGPFMVSTMPLNDRIMYNSSVQQIDSDTNDETQLCGCLEATVQLQLDAVYDSQNSSIELNIRCSTDYVTPFEVTIIDKSGFINRTTHTCSNETIKFMMDSGCSQELRLCGYFTFENGSVVMDCLLNCSNSLIIPCPTSPPTRPGPSPFPVGAIVGIVFGVLLLIVIVEIGIVIITLMIRRYRIKQLLEVISQEIDLTGDHKDDEAASVGSEEAASVGSKEAAPCSKDSDPTDKADLDTKEVTIL